MELDFLCSGCEQGWQISLFNEDEGEGEIILDAKLVETVTSEDAKVMGTPTGTDARPDRE